MFFNQNLDFLTLTVKAMKTRGRFIHFWGTPPNSIGFHCKAVFCSLFCDTGRGGNLRWAWKTHSIEYNSSFFWGTPPNSIGFYCKVGFSHCSTAPVVGVPFGELKKIFFLIQYEKKLIISGDIRNYIFWHQPWKTMKTKGRFIHFLWNTT